MAVLDELLVELGFEYDPKDLEEFESNLAGTVDTVKKLATVVVTGTAALVGFVSATTSATDEQGKLANEVGVSVGMIDSLQFANKRAGGSSDGLSSSLQQLAVRISETSRGVGSGIEAFGILGISVTDLEGNLKSTDQVLFEVADKFQGLSNVEQIELAEKLGLRDSIRLLQQGSGGIEDLIKEAKALGVTTKEDAIIAEQFQDSLVDVWQIIKQVSRVITRILGPAMEDIANRFTEWWKVNRDIIEQNVPKFIDQATKALKFLSIAAAAFVSIKLINTLAAALKLMKGLTLSTLLFNTAISFIPTLIAVGIAAIALLAEDAKVFFEGGESFIGSMIEKFPQWADEIKVVAAILATLADLVGMIFEGWSSIFSLFGSGTLGKDLVLVFKQLLKDMKDASVLFSTLVELTTMVFNGWKEIFKLFNSDTLGQDLKLVFGQIQKDISSFVENMKNKLLGFFDDFKNRISETLSIGNIKDSVLNIFGDDDNNNTNEVIISKLAEESNSSTSNPNGNIANSSNVFSQSDISNSSAVDNSVTIEGGIAISVEASDNPEETGIAVRRELQDFVEQASIDSNSAVRI